MKDMAKIWTTGGSSNVITIRKQVMKALQLQNGDIIEINIKKINTNNNNYEIE